MREFAVAWYGVLNSVFVGLGAPLREISPGAGASLTVAVLLGVLAATSPCQLSTNASAIAYLGTIAGRPNRRVAWSALAYIGGKVLIYSLAGLLFVLMGEGLQAVALPAVRTARKALGPLMVLVGLVLLGFWKPRIGFGHALSVRLRDRAQGDGPFGAFLLGTAFAFAFCPTLALLFFGYVIPMALASGAGPLYPAAFALGTTVPLLMAAGVLEAGADSPWMRRLGTWEPRLRKIAGTIFLLAGINDTLLYWLL